MDTTMQPQRHVSVLHHVMAQSEFAIMCELIRICSAMVNRNTCCRSLQADAAVSTTMECCDVRTIVPSLPQINLSQCQGPLICSCY